MAIVKTDMILGVDVNSISGVSSGNILNDAAGEAWAFSFHAPKTGTIEAVVFRAGTVTSFQDMTISIETVGANGIPSGANYGGSTPGTWTGGTSNTSPEVALAVSATATVGDLICVRGEWASTAGNLNIQFASGSSANTRRFPKVLPDVGAGFILTQTGAPMICLKYSGSEYLVPIACYPPCTFAFLSINSGTSPQEIGLWWTPNAKLEIGGAWIYGRTFGTSQTSTMALYTTPAGTPASQRSLALTHDQFSVVNQQSSMYWNPYEIVASTDYVVAFLEDNTSNHTIFYVDVASADHWGGWAGGASLTYASRNSGGGAFTKTTTRKITGGLYITGVEDGAGGGAASSYAFYG